MWLYALVIMFSRVVVLAHHPSDVIAGALVGAVGAALVRRWFAARRLVFSGEPFGLSGTFVAADRRRHRPGGLRAVGKLAKSLKLLPIEPGRDAL